MSRWIRSRRNRRRGWNESNQIRKGEGGGELKIEEKG